ncbi:MAG: DUF4212 domain-containing protein [Cobetia sp.]|jgi:putative solute:sodium symporter small subunit|uniref:DUF4212 domain-containing protein n=1 Tax=Cobetia amphilecti TaxID=1055104 RepID=A0AAP4WVQ2_9GAMM|nr:MULTISPECIES: DUF4212 domain-containing protein [Cobetia]AVV34586.1 DUF4212 domain-containing protein [Halomonas sp. SF2003]MBR9755782.1 DUF4212 domain-containing protein [Gammaproteobacteria bacterium]NVN57041.1 DUF4212 domain-containing protein [bacterium Scap17]TCJ27102.1 DUF4212 domain-containing protein [Halomonas sp. GDM18]KGA02194.1 membrane protein [Cobetia amphilecti]|tara:strand:+ start:7562 stop:7819 length:258 start_codon:yes stop_codon:yes gene_type:complete
MKEANAKAYWSANIKLIMGYLVVWFVVSYGCGILLVDVLNNIQFFGFKLGFWFAQQGAIYFFLALIILYARSMNKLDERFDVHEQ